jgi:broad specificity phosphatase PhoE
MSQELPRVILVRHGETLWSPVGRHTGSTDIPLTPAGENEAKLLASRLEKLAPDHVITSPLLRARETARLAGYGHATVDADFAEWNYGLYEGMTTEEIQQQFPGWNVFRNGGSRGETVEDAIERGDRAVAKLRELEGTTLVFCHGHFSRVIAARWCGLGLEICPHLMLNTTAMSVLGYDRSLDRPAILHWNLKDSVQSSDEAVA